MNSNGIITAPISLKDDVYHVLGASPSGAYYDLGYACKNEHGKINKWSLYKPVNLNKISALSEADFESVDYGMEVLSYEGVSAAGEAMSAVLQGETWDYTPPQTWARLTDFENYNHNQEPWFTMKFSNGNTSIESEFGNSLRFELASDINWLIDTFGTFEQYRGKSGLLDLGLLFASGTSTNVSTVIYYKICDIVDLVSDADKQLSVTFPETGVFVEGSAYRVIPVLTTDTSRTAATFYTIREEVYASTWYPLPSTICSVTLSASGSAELAKYSVDVPSFNVVVDDDFNVTINDLPIVFTNSGTSNGTLEVTCVMVDFLSGSGYSDETIYFNTVEVAANSSTTINIKDVGRYTSYVSGTGNATIQVTIRMDSETATETYTFQLFEK